MGTKSKTCFAALTSLASVVVVNSGRGFKGAQWCAVFDHRFASHLAVNPAKPQNTRCTMAHLGLALLRLNAGGAMPAYTEPKRFAKRRMVHGKCRVQADLEGVAGDGIVERCRIRITVLHHRLQSTLRSKSKANTGDREPGEQR